MDVRLKIAGKEYHLQHMPLREKHEAELALGMGMTDTETASVLVMLFVAMRQEEPTKPAGMIADEILNADLFDMESVEEASPLETEGNGSAPDHPAPTGLRPLEPSASPSTSTN
jgi:hypothetical protein